jgi:hypothetical protein
MRLHTLLVGGLLTMALAACGTQPLTGVASASFETKLFDFTQIAPLVSNTSTLTSGLSQSSSATGGNNASAANFGQANLGTLQQNAQGIVPINVGTQTQGPNVAVNVVPQIGAFGSTGYFPTSMFD